MNAALICKKPLFTNPKGRSALLKERKNPLTLFGISGDPMSGLLIKIRATGKKSNEEQCSMFGCRVLVCLGLQFETNFEGKASRYEEGSFNKSWKFVGHDFELVKKTKNDMDSALRSIASLWIISGAFAP